MVDVDLTFSKGDWKFDGDVIGDYTEMEYNEENQIIGQTSTEYRYIKQSKQVGDIIHNTYVGGLTLKPIKGLNIQGLLKVYDDNYFDWSPESREVTGDEDRSSSLEKHQSYSKLDLHLSYKLFKLFGLDLTVHGHVFNALDNVYVQDLTDNSKYNGYGDKLHLDLIMFKYFLEHQDTTT